MQNEIAVNIQDRTLDFACEIVKLYDLLQKNRGAARHLSGQLLDAGTSIGANMEEADAAQSKADFVCKCRIALKEARETRYWLKLLQRSNAHVSAALLQESNEIVAVITSIVKSARRPSIST